MGNEGTASNPESLFCAWAEVCILLLYICFTAESVLDILSYQHYVALVS